MTPTLHGENFLEPIKQLPNGKKKSHKQYIVGHSETGHHHVLESKTEFDVVEDMAKQVFLEVKSPAKLKHQKSFDVHETLTVEPGIYKVHHKTEYNPFTKIIERVWD